jgi:hypothetical protein
MNVLRRDKPRPDSGRGAGAAAANEAVGLANSKAVEGCLSEQVIIVE